MRGGSGPLAAPAFRRLFGATTITTVGDRVAIVALAFAVLDVPGAGPADLGYVLGAQKAVEAAVLLAGGVVADRLPRQLVLVGASLVQAGAQAATAAVVLAGQPSLLLLVGLQVLYGAGDGLVIPAEVGLVPQTVRPEQLQQANALQGLSRNVCAVLGPAFGGLLVVAASPGVGLAVDAGSFLACAVLLAGIRVPARAADGPRPGFFHELHEGWREFASRTWLWSTVSLFAIGNLVHQSWSVLGPSIAKDELGGPGAWAIILTCGGLGAVVGSLVALRVRPSRPLLVSVLCPAPVMLTLVALALPAPTPVLAAVNLVAGVGLAVHLALWFTVFQQQVPEHAQSRVSAYDALGSFVLVPLGAALAGPVAAAIGEEATLLGGAAVMLACTLTMLTIPSVWAIRPRAAGAAAPRLPAYGPDP